MVTVSDIRRLFASRGLVGNASILAGGTLVAQAFGFLAIPFIALFYGPQAYGQFVVIQALTGMITAVALLRFDLAIIQAHKKKDAQRLQLISILALLVGISIFAFAALLAHDQIASALSLHSIGSFWLVICIISSLFAGLTTILTASLIRYTRSAFISSARIVQTLVAIPIQLYLGYAFNGHPYGLLIGFIVGQICAVGVLLAGDVLKAYQDRRNFDRAEMIDVVIRYKEFPRYAGSTVILNTISTHFLPIGLSFFFGSGMAGIVALTQRLTQFPIMLLTQPVWQLVFSRLRGLGDTKRRELLRAVYAAMGFGLALPLMFVALRPDLVIAVLGPRWAAIAPGFFTAFCLLSWVNATSNSISYFTAFGKYRAESTTNIGLFIARFAALIIGSIFFLADQAVYMFVFAGASVYLILTFYWAYRLVGVQYVLTVMVTALSISAGLVWTAGALANGSAIVLMYILLSISLIYYLALAGFLARRL